MAVESRIITSWTGTVVFDSGYYFEIDGNILCLLGRRLLILYRRCGGIISVNIYDAFSISKMFFFFWLLVTVTKKARQKET